MTDQIDAVDPVDEPVDVSVEQDADTPALETEGEDGEAHDAEPARPKKSAKERIDELTWKAREAERQAEYWREQATRPQPAQEAQYEPEPDDYSPQAIAVRVRAEIKAEQEAEKLQARRTEILAASGEREGAKLFFTDPTLPVTREMADVVMASDRAGDLAEYLGRNRDEATRIADMPPHMQGRELARIEQRFAAAPKGKTATDAPIPAPTVRGSGGKFTVAADTNDFAAFEKQYRGT